MKDVERDSVGRAAAEPKDWTWEDICIWLKIGYGPNYMEKCVEVPAGCLTELLRLATPSPPNVVE